MENSNDILLTMKGICKYFPGVRALENVDFTLKAGEIHALVGENGAGKSTLIKVLTGVYPKNAGKIVLEGKDISPTSTLESQNCGISTVYQEVNLCTNLTVAENIFIGREPMKHGMIDWHAINSRAEDLLQNVIHLNIDVTKTLDNYSVAIQQMVAIARAIDIEAKVLILDEPTSSLDDSEVQNLFRVVRALKEKNMGIVFVSHFLDQIYELCDRVTVLRNGKLVGEYEVANLPKVQLISKMIGKELGDIQSLKKAEHKEEHDVFMEVKDASSVGKVIHLNQTINKGEVLGLAGLLGSGRTEIAELLFGIYTPATGTLSIDSKPIQFNDPLNAMQQKIAFCPEDRKAAGIFGDLSVRDNIIVALQAKRGILHFLPLSEQTKIADDYIKKLQIKVSTREQSIKNLSGGNQQKVIIARWLASQPELLILDEPTRGIDIGTKTEIQKMIIKLATETNMSVVFISSEMEEMIRTCSRLVVLRDHKKIAELTGTDMNMDTIMSSIAGGASK